MKITDVSKFIVSYLDINGISDELSKNILNIMDKEGIADEKLMSKIG